MFYRFRRNILALWPKINVELLYYHNLNSIVYQKSSLKVSVFKLSFNNIKRIIEVKKLNIELLKKRLLNEDECYVSEHDGRLVSYHWVQEKGKHFIQQAGEYIDVKNDEVWIYHVRVSDHVRGNNINSFVYCEILKESKSRGMQKVWIYTNKNNLANRKGLEKLGFIKSDIIYSINFNNKFYKLFQKKIC